MDITWIKTIYERCPTPEDMREFLDTRSPNGDLYIPWLDPYGVILGFADDLDDIGKVLRKHMIPVKNRSK